MLGLRTTIYKVGNITEAKKWYALAFKKAPYFDEPYYVGYNIGGFELGLQPAEESDQEKIPTVISYWGVEDIEEAYQHLLSCGASSDNPPMNVGGPLMVATVKDPWNNIVGIIYNPVFKIEGDSDQ